MLRQFCWLLCFGVGLAVGFAQSVHAQPKNSPKALSPQELADQIDRAIADHWKTNKVTPANPASDAEFLRRVYLDLAGRIPKVSETRTFLQDDSEKKRERLIEALLESAQYVNHFSNTMGDLMVPQENNPRFAFFGRAFKQWVRQKVEANTPYDEMVQELLIPERPKLGQPINRYNATSAFFQVNENKAENVAAAVSRLFLGVRLECAQCHDHPFSSWKRDQFWEFAAFFADTTTQRIIPNRPQTPVQSRDGKITIPGTQKTVMAKFLDGTEPDGKEEVRQKLVRWMTSPENPYFGRTAANRIWAHFFGIGLIDPVDDEPTEDNPPSHPKLLKTLTEQFIAHDYDTKYLIRAIVLSKTYQLSSIQSHKSQSEPRLFARMSIRGLTPKQLFDSLCAATGFRETTRIVNGFAYPNPNSVEQKFLGQFSSTDTPTEKQTSILQALSLMNGTLVNNATSVENSQTLAAVINSPFFSTEEKLETLYLATLTRYPTEREMSRLSEYVKTGGARKDSNAALADVFWALLNSSEFTLNH